LSKLDERGGMAALSRVDIRLADLGNVTLSGSIRTDGFGTLEQRVNERSKEDYLEYDLTTNLDLGKLIPKSAGIQIPVTAGISKTISKPRFDPLDLDVELQEKIDNAASKAAKDSIRRDAIDET